MRLEELDVLCAVLECTPNDLMSPEPDKVAARRPRNIGCRQRNGDHADGPNGNGGRQRRTGGAPAVRQATLDPTAVADPADVGRTR